MNMNELAAKVTRLEGKRLSLSVAQVKEVIGDGYGDGYGDGW